MQVSSGRLNGIRAVLAIVMLLGLFLAVSRLLFTRSTFESVAPAGEPYSSFVEGCLRTVGALALTWAVAAGIALRDAVRNLGLVQAIAIALGIMGVGNLYYTIVAEEPMAADWVFSAVFIVLFAVLAVLCPWKANLDSVQTR